MFECQDEPARRCSATVAASGTSNGRRGDSIQIIAVYILPETNIEPTNDGFQ